MFRLSARIQAVCIMIVLQAIVLNAEAKPLPCIRRVPTIVAKPVSASVLPGLPEILRDFSESIQFDVSVKNNDSPECISANYRVTYTDSLGQDQTLAPWAAINQVPTGTTGKVTVRLYLPGYTPPGKVNAIFTVTPQSLYEGI